MLSYVEMLELVLSEARDVLELLERRPVNESSADDECAVCGSVARKGHDFDCPLASTLAAMHAVEVLRE